jgi:hypothetical protein
MARPVPVQASTDDPTAIAREGYVSVIMIPRIQPSSADTSATFDKERKVSLKLRARQIGQLIAWKMPFLNGTKSNGSSLTVNAYATGSVPVTMELKPLPDQAEEPMVQVTMSPKTQDAQSVTMAISVGELKALQVLLEAALPSLYGWTSRSLTGSQYSSTITRQTASKSPEDFFKQFSASAGGQ